MDGSGVGVEGRAGQGRVPDCLGGLSRVGISSRSTRPWNGQPPSIYNMYTTACRVVCASLLAYIDDIYELAMQSIVSVEEYISTARQNTNGKMDLRNKC